MLCSCAAWLRPEIVDFDGSVSDFSPSYSSSDRLLTVKSSDFSSSSSEAELSELDSFAELDESNLLALPFLAAAFFFASFSFILR